MSDQGWTPPGDDRRPGEEPRSGEESWPSEEPQPDLSQLPPPTGGPVVPVDQPPRSAEGPTGDVESIEEPPVAQDDEWQQLDPRMLLLGPVRAIGSLLIPGIIALFGLGQGGGLIAFSFIGVAAALAVAFGLVPWFTTRYRFTDTQLQVRRGLFNRRVMTAPLDRVRSVDLESTLLHRLLRLSKVKVGTGVDDTRIELDSLTTTQAAELRRYLLRRSEVVAAGAASGAAGQDTAGGQPAAEGSHPDSAQAQAVADPEGDELARIDWSWLRYAPFSLSSLAIVAGVFGVGSQAFNDVEIDASAAEGVWDWAEAQSWWLIVTGALILLLIAWVALSTLTYVAQWWNLRLVREPGGTLRVTKGLFTTQSTTVEETRVRGVRMVEPALLRLVRGGELFTLATGVGAEGTTRVLPPSPRSVVRRVGASVLSASPEGASEGGTSEADEATVTRQPMVVVLRRHGRRSLYRQIIQAQWDAIIVAILVGVGTWYWDWSWWIPVAVLLALTAIACGYGVLAYRHLGHALTAEHFVSGDGALNRRRTVLERSGVIGWVIKQGFFQRRRRLATLVATTAAGPEQVEIRDLPYEDAVALAHHTTPGMLEEFLIR